MTGAAARFYAWNLASRAGKRPQAYRNLVGVLEQHCRSRLQWRHRVVLGIDRVRPSEVGTMEEKDEALIETLKGVVFSGEVTSNSHSKRQELAEELRRLADLCDPEPGSKRRSPGSDGSQSESSADRNGASSPARRPRKKRRKGKRSTGRPFDITKYQRRYVALHMSYVGWGYHGYACQKHNDNTIEEHFFNALRMTRLIREEADYKELKYSRCGRTDKGVSALGQVVGLYLRSTAKVGEDEASVENEIDYPRVLNSAMPPEIRILGWSPVPETFDARYSARYRVYKYYMISHDRDPLDIKAIQKASKSFVGAHDFRNFCKLDVEQTTRYVRNLMECRLDPVENIQIPGSKLYVLTTKGSSFLWHQIRCMVAVLLMIGKGLEQPEVVEEMLDVDKVTAKPQFHLASELPLLLYECGFKEDIKFLRSNAAVDRAMDDMQDIIDGHVTGASLVGQMLGVMSGLDTTASDRPERKEKHIPLLKRVTELSVGERIAKQLQKVGST
ncbi:hypothetical protein BSKO_08334 [Bryopsis sp. KO-2023]|nr:hypothetical protein BSKO_08334 [Bryopsis sp. KO-2023]